MAGGVGSRFWPVSRQSHPKQFLDILGTGKTLIQMTVDRLKKVVPEDHIYILTNAAYSELTKEQTGFPDSRILKEPQMKNTAPCIAYAAHKIHALDKNANMIVASSDHLILDESNFVKTITVAMNHAKDADEIITIGIVPTRPDTGYGYIEAEISLQLKKAIPETRIYKVGRFTEKPVLEKAKEFIAAGNYFWNSGIFVWRCDTILKALGQFQPGLNLLFTSNKYNSPQEQEFVDKSFAACQAISIDYGVLEHAKNVTIVAADFGWSDLGTWGSLYTLLQKDDSANAIFGQSVKLSDSSGNFIHVPKDKKVVIHGLNDFIVVEANGILMIVPREDEQKIRELSKFFGE